ncbi:hypothetical protein E2C01_087662 [Portunus trituberculatus]|uniref:Uncharacterized protein n=1 Tax=Portunus trituberculatus TaxID=210409 RepID=A0A5B7JGZ0_PORTR|nr:hypothetical protein [Portunus trituberculatus]
MEMVSFLGYDEEEEDEEEEEEVVGEAGVPSAASARQTTGRLSAL